MTIEMLFSMWQMMIMTVGNVSKVKQKTKHCITNGKKKNLNILRAIGVAVLRFLIKSTRYSGLLLITAYLDTVNDQV